MIIVHEACHLYRPIEKRVYIDEAGINGHLIKEYAYATKGHKVLGFRSGKRFTRENFITALCKKRILAPCYFNGACYKTFILHWAEQFLIPVLKQGQYVILDNASFHKTTTLETLIEKAGCHIIFLPPYSPDFNSIENFWAWIKRKIKDTSASFATLQTKVDQAFKMSHNYGK